MAEGGHDGVRFYCHTCKEDIEARQTEEELLCPQCNGGFVECMEAANADSVPASASGRGATASASGGGGDASSSDEDVSSLPGLLNFMSPSRVAQQSHTSRRGRNLDHNYYQEQMPGEGTHVLSAAEGPVEVHPAIEALVSHLPVSVHVQPNGQQVYVHGHHVGFGSDGPIHPMASLMNMMFQGPHMGGMGNMGGMGGAMPMAGQMGDYVFGQGGLDAVISQLMDSMDGPRPVPVSQDVIAALPRVPISKADQEKQSSCSVCFDEFELAEETIQLPCSHSFHPNCILPWLEQHNTCPVCRKTVDGQPEPTTAEQSAAATPSASTSAAATGGVASRVTATSATGSATAAAASGHSSSRQQPAAAGATAAASGPQSLPASASATSSSPDDTQTLIDSVAQNVNALFGRLGPGYFDSATQRPSQAGSQQTRSQTSSQAGSRQTRSQTTAADQQSSSVDPEPSEQNAEDT
eukprot:scpid47644/ scgid30825/ E3 ubiquitin-protein ligase RNF115; RING finger protein 115; Rabring 7; Zinc finger protein 364